MQDLQHSLFYIFLQDSEKSKPHISAKDRKQLFGLRTVKAVEDSGNMEASEGRQCTPEG